VTLCPRILLMTLPIGATVQPKRFIQKCDGNVANDPKRTCALPAPRRFEAPVQYDVCQASLITVE
jgi:hypothetical protein